MRLTLPKTVTEFASPSGKEAIAEAERIINAYANAQIIIVVAGKEYRAVFELAGGAAIARVKVS